MRIIFTLSICLFILTFSQTASSQEEVVAITRCALRPVNEIPVDISVKDNVDNAPVKKATISIIPPYRNDTLHFVADDSGVVRAKFSGIQNSYVIKITAIGYQDTCFRIVSTGKQSVLLERKSVEMPEVVIVPGIYIACERRINICRISKIKASRSIPDSSEVFNSMQVKHCKIFPNPAIKGNVVNLAINSPEKDRVVIKIFSMEGRLLQSTFASVEKGQNLLPIKTDTRWSTGTYFFQVFYAKGSVAASGKVIIQ